MENDKEKKPYHHGDLHAALILETERMLSEKQLDKITLQALGSRLNVARSAPYRHFKSKNNLMCVVATRAFEARQNALMSIWAREDLSIHERFRCIILDQLQFAIKQPDYYRLMYREPLVDDNESQDLSKIREELFGNLAMFLISCQEDGAIAQTDPEQQLFFVWSTVHGMASLLVDQHVKPEEVNLQAMVVDPVMRGLQA